MARHSLQQLLKEITKDLGCDQPAVAQSDDALVRSALESLRPDLLHFFRKVSRDKSTLTLEFGHVAAAQECQLESGRLLVALERLAGGSIARTLRCRGPR
ncbi:MAG: hypothetical protein GEEBNDBF_02544 [bacterium]|nr:hypothetical protein [bacterium]